jgi:glucose-fructose oxidoreductase
MTSAPKGSVGRPRIGGSGPVRFAVVGLGYFAQSSILPAFKNARRSCRLSALFSDDDTKLRSLKRRYDVEHALPYDRYDELLASGAVDAVYIAVPNDLHADYAIRAARAGVHVLCEKPIAGTSVDAERMITACADGGVKLMIAYRLHFEEANLSAIEVVNRGAIGEPRYLSTLFSQQIVPGNTRTQSVHHGGPLRDLGVYCINAARYVFRDEPTEVTAFAAQKGDDQRFAEIHEQIGAVLRFPGERLAQITCSFGAAEQSSYTVVGTRGSLRVSPAYGASTDLAWELTVDGKTKKKIFKKRDQVAPELVEFGTCILEDRAPAASGREGLADLRVIEAIEASIKSAGRVEVSRQQPERRPSLRQERRAPAQEVPTLVNVQAPTAH